MKSTRAVALILAAAGLAVPCAQAKVHLNIPMTEQERVSFDPALDPFDMSIPLIVPGTEPEAKGLLGVVVVAVSGKATVLPTAGAEPIALEVGQMLRPGARVQTGLGKVEPALTLALIIIVVMSLLAWLPAPVSGGAKVWAWLVILWALIAHVTHLVVAGNLGDVIKASPNAALVPWIIGGGFSIGSAYLA